MTQAAPSRAAWRTSSYSGANGNCVEVAYPAPHLVAIRDSRNPSGHQLTFSPRQWEAFTRAVKQAAR